MHNYLLDIARNGLMGKKKTSIYLFLTCFLSVTFAVLNVSITGSLNKTREELRYTAYGEWNVAVYSQNPLSAVLQDTRIHGYGTAQIYGNLLDDGETVLTGIGTLDENLRALGRLEVESRKFPTEDNEIAIEADVLSNLGYDYELGQTLTLRIIDRKAIEKRGKMMAENGKTVEDNDDVIIRKFILCGVLREYTRLWDTGAGKATLAGACVTEHAAKEIGSPCAYQYFLSTEQDESHELFQQLKKDYAAAENTSAYGTLAKEEYHYFNLALILMITIAAVITIYSVQLKEQMRSIQLFRTIGATKKQLSSMIFYETMLILLPAALGGIGAGSLATWILLQILMKQSVSVFYISIPAGLIAGILPIWFGAVFGARFLIFRYALRGRLSARKRLLPRTGKRQKSWKELSLALLSSAGMLTVIFCYAESLSPIYINDSWSHINSYTISKNSLGTQTIFITEKYLDDIKLLPGIETVTAWRQLSGTLDFPGIDENPFCSLLTEQSQAAGESGETVPEGMQCRILGVAEDNWDMFFQYANRKIDREKFRNGESVLLYLPYNTETGVALNGELYQDFGIKPGDRITITAYGRGELSKDGSGFITTENGNMPYEEYQELTATSQATAQVAGVITADLLEEAYLNLSPDYYMVIASNAFAKKLTAADKDGILLDDYTWSNQEYGYSTAFIYTGMDAEYLSTDYLMAKSAAEHRLEFSNSREQHAAYRQEAIQALLHIWICSICIFLILMLILLNIEMLHGLALKRSFALLQVIGMSRRQLRIRLAAKGLLVSLASCLMGHGEYFLYFFLKHIGTYHRFAAELEYTGTFAELLKNQFEASCLQAGWNLPMHLAFCAFGMACVFLLFFGSQNRVLKENIRESLS